MKKVRIALIGAGNIAKEHLKAYAQVEDAEIAAICDINPVTLKETADAFGIVNRYNSVEEMLASEKELDAADVCVWNCNHAECAIAALEAGLDVLCEKPMAYSTEEAVRMQKVAEKNGRILMIGFVTRFDAETLAAKDFIDNGYLGDIYYAKAQYVRRHGNPGGWFADKARSGGGPVIDLGVHVIDRARYLMGKPLPVSVYAATFTKLGRRPTLKTGMGYQPRGASDKDVCDVEDFGTAIIRFDNGAVIQLETAYSINGVGVNGLDLCGERGGLATGKGKLTYYSDINGFLTDTVIDYSNLKGSRPMFTAEMAEFCRCVREHEQPAACAEDGVIVMKILDAIYESARTGHEVLIEN